jgi:hypothetical protein
MECQSTTKEQDMGRKSETLAEKRVELVLVLLKNGEPAEGGDVLTPEDGYTRGKAITLLCWQSWVKAAKRKLDEAM